MPDIYGPSNGSYIERLEQIAGEKSGGSLLNVSPDNVPYIMHVLFREARHKAEILVKDINAAAYTHPLVILDVLHFLQDFPQAALDILSEKEPDPSSALLSALKDAGFQDRVAVAQVPVVAQETYPEYFILIDGKYSRFESMKRQGSMPSLYATILFGNGGSPKIKSLQRIFTRLRDLSSIKPLAALRSRAPEVTYGL